jgi:glycosyltransferase involved in cell wall biosynthesis
VTDGFEGPISSRRYVLVTAARNEESHIEKTIASVVDQTILPIRWVVVSDGSTDATDDLVLDQAERHEFIRFVRREPDGERNFGSKVFALRLAVEALESLEYDFIGNLDADVSFPRDYFERVLAEFDSDPRLGIAGGVVYDRVENRWVRQHTDPEWSVAGAVQMFRRSCFDEVGGYEPFPRGGEDAVAEIRARMAGYGIRGLEDLQVKHHQLMGTKKGDILHARFEQGRMEYGHGYHPLFEAGRCVLRIRERPFVMGSLWRLAGFLVDGFLRTPKDVPRDVEDYLRKEQSARMRAFLRPGRSGRSGR